MAEFGDRGSIFQRLDKYIEDNLELEMEMGLYAFPNKGKDRYKEKLDAFIAERGNYSEGKEMFFCDVLEKMMNDLDLDPPDVYKPAYITRDRWAKWLGPDRPHPGRFGVIAIGFSFIQSDVKKNGYLVLPPEKRMNKLLYSGGGVDYILKHGTNFDLTIMFCLNENIFDVLDVNELLAYKKLPLLPDGKKKGDIDADTDP
jgi:hypothetical protein